MSRKDLLSEWIDQNKDCFYKVSDSIWENPELSMQEHFACSRIADLLESLGFSVERGAGGLPTAFTAVWGQGAPVIGFGCEYDALPGLSQKKDVNEKAPAIPQGPGHGCGHNLLSIGGAMAAAALKNLMEHEGLSGTLKVFGTPAEEICIGKPFMAKAGVFAGVDVFLDWHPSHLNRGGCCATNAYFNVKYHFKGKSAHGNAPWLGKSAQDAGLLMGISLEMLREHIPPASPEAATTLNYAFPDTGNGFPGVVPDKSTLWCVGRMKNADIAADILARADNCAKGCAMATGTSVEAEVITATHDMIPNHKLSLMLDANLRAVGVPGFSEKEQADVKELQRAFGVEETGYASVISPVQESYQPVTDSSEYSWFAPIGFLNVALCPSENTNLHSWAATRLAGSESGKKTVLTASKTLAATACDLLMNPEDLAEAKSEWEQRMGGRKYTSLLPQDMTPDLNINKDIMDRFK